MDNWTPGNKPEKDGWYQTSYCQGGVGILQFREGKWPKGWAIDLMTAYAPIHLKEHYVKPKPERELLCPFCQSNDDCGIDKWGGTMGFFCNICMARLPGIQKERTFEIYDKLNPRER